MSLNPLVGDFNVRLFLSLVQSDGFNPLTVATSLFRILPSKLPPLLDSFPTMNNEQKQKLSQLLSKPFRIGQLFLDLNNAGLRVPGDRMDFLNKIASSSEQVFRIIKNIF